MEHAKKSKKLKGEKLAKSEKLSKSKSKNRKNYQKVGIHLILTLKIIAKLSNPQS